MDLFEKHGMTEFTEFPTMPEELRGMDIEPDYLPPINIESSRVYQYACIKYDIGEAPAFNNFVGYNFLRRKKNSYFFKEIIEKKEEQSSIYDNEKEDYALILFEAHEAEAVIEKFKLPFYVKNDTYQLKDLLNAGKLEF